MALKVTLNESEVKLVERITKDRSSFDKKKGFKDHRRAKKQTARFIETNGFGGEIAFCKLFNIFPDLVTDHVSDYDAILHDGTKVEIKTTEYGHGKLIARHVKSSADIYVLVTGTMPDYIVVGFVPAEVVKAGKDTLNGKTAYIVEQKDFVPIEELKPQYLNEDQKVNRKAKRNSRKPSGSGGVKKTSDAGGSTRRARSNNRRKRRGGDLSD